MVRRQRGGLAPQTWPRRSPPLRSLAEQIRDMSPSRRQRIFEAAGRGRAVRAQGRGQRRRSRREKGDENEEEDDDKMDKKDDPRTIPDGTQIDPNSTPKSVSGRPKINQSHELD